ncbi:MAG: V-type ATPase subunit [Oscillospiraceae bacterium]
MPSDNYPYAVGRVKLIENSLLDRSKLLRLRELNYFEALKQLVDWGYAADNPVKTDPDALIDFRRAEVRSIVYDITPNPGLTDLFYLDMDATNIKLLLKSRLLGGEELADEALSKGVFDVSLLRAMVAEKSYSELGEPLCSAMSQLEETLTHHVEPRLLSAAVDNAFFSYIQSSLRKNKNEFCKRYFTSKIDFTNVLSVLRARELHWDKSDFEPMIVCGGDIDRNALLDAVIADEDKLPAILGVGENGDSIKKALGLYMGGSLEEARDMINESLLSLARDERFDSFGIGPIAYFMLASEHEFRTLRVLFAKKRSDKTK